MFDYRGYILKGFKDAIGKMADYQIIFNSNEFYKNGVLLEEDLAELQALIEEKNAQEEKTIGDDLKSNEEDAMNYENDRQYDF